MTDYSAFDGPVASREVSDFRRAVSARSQYAEQTTPLQLGLLLAGATLIAVFVIGLASIFAPLLREVMDAGVSAATIVYVVIPVVFAGGGGLVIVTAARRAYRSAGSWERWLLLSRYAASQGFEFEPEQESEVRAALPPASAARLDLAGRSLRRWIVAGAAVFAVVFVATWVLPFISR